MRAHGEGSVTLDRRSKIWNFFFWDSGRRRSKTVGPLAKYPTKSAAWKAAKLLRDAVGVKLTITETSSPTAPLMSTLIEQYRDEKMPKRIDTRRTYEAWLGNHIIPKWGNCALTDLQARHVEMWLTSLDLSPKSKAHIRGLLSVLWDYAMWRGDIATQRNPMELVTIKGSSKRTHQPRSLTVAEFQGFVRRLGEPFNLIALLCVSLGLRISEALALKWGDVDWLGAKLKVERGIVCQKVDTTKTAESRKQLTVDAAVLDLLKLWKQTTQFPSQDDWMFASPVQLGRLPWSYDAIWRVYQKAAKAAGIGSLGTHTMRHTFRSWLDSVGTPVGVQQKLMRHADIRTTMNIYGDAASDEMNEAHGKIADLALNGREKRQVKSVSA
jgi:integrase